MKILLILMLFLQIKPLPVINAVVETSGENHENSIEAYKTNEFWGNWSFPLSPLLSASSTKTKAGKITYLAKNIQDYNLNTAWVPQKDAKNGKEYFEYVFKFPSGSGYGSTYQFQGTCNIFNGYCKSLKTWQGNARVKKLLVCLNKKPVCHILLKDTWHLQTIDMSRLFVNRTKKMNMHAKFEIRSGDKLTFVIKEVYPGTKYSDAAISEFLCVGDVN